MKATMKEIKAVIAPQRLEALRDAMLSLPDFPGMTVCKAEGYHLPHTGPGRARVRDVLDDHGHRLLVLMVLPDDRVAEAQAALLRCAASAPGGVRLWVTEVLHEAVEGGAA